MKVDDLLARDVNRLRRVIAKQLPDKVGSPTLVVLVGLPGSGKSYFAARLSEKVPAVILESDLLRKIVVRRPVYSQFESYRLFRAIHELVRELLANRNNVIVDATNLSEAARHPLYGIAVETGAKIIVVHLNTPREVAKERLSYRLLQPDTYSDADWVVYQKLESGFEPIAGPHHEVTRTMDISPIIDKIVAEIKQSK